MLIDNRYKPRMLPKPSKGKKTVGSSSRNLIVLALFAAGFLGLIGRGVHMQTLGFDFLQKESEQRIVRTQTIPASRGMITDRNNTTLALSAPADSLHIVPMKLMRMPSEKEAALLSVSLGVPEKELKENLKNGSGAFIRKYKLSDKDIALLSDTLLELPSAGQIDKLSALLDMTPEAVIRQMSNFTGENSDFVYLKRQIDKETADKVRALDIKGLAFHKESKRHYPMGSLFAQIIGFTDIDGKGQEGLELAYNDLLKGQDGKKVILRDRKGNAVDSLESELNRDPVDGQSMVLSLDQRIQTLAYEELNRAVRHHRAKAGSAVVLDAQTGEILAMVNNPSFDPNNPRKVKPEDRKNRAISNMYEFGSVVKPFTVAKALDDKKIHRASWFNTEPYKLPGATKPIRDTASYPSLDVRGILQKSSNVGVSKIAAMYQPEELYRFYSEVGYNQRPAIRFPSESGGMLPNWKTWKPVEQASMSYGYRVQMSLLQLARAYTVFSDGKLLPVSIKKLDGIPEGRQVISPNTAREMRELMISVTEKGGTGVQGAVKGFDVAAKTGTAKKAKTKLVNGKVRSDGYYDSRYVASFVGLAPAQKPRIIVAVSIDDPVVNGSHGGSVAGPVFSKVMGGSLNILGVAPTKALSEAE